VKQKQGEDCPPEWYDGCTNSTSSDGRPRFPKKPPAARAVRALLEWNPIIPQGVEASPSRLPVPAPTGVPAGQEPEVVGEASFGPGRETLRLYLKSSECDPVRSRIKLAASLTTKPGRVEVSGAWVRLRGRRLGFGFLATSAFRSANIASRLSKRTSSCLQGTHEET